MRKLLCCLLLFGSSCTLKEQDKSNVTAYFDLAAYFKNEAARLAKSNLAITKTVAVNGTREEKKVKISDWEKEFETFISSDINKASWRGSFKLTKTEGEETYTSSSAKIPVKKLQIFYQNNKIRTIKVFINNNNNLYTSKDSLAYYPDSLYQINKTQQIKLMDEKKYIITGRFK